MSENELDIDENFQSLCYEYKWVVDVRGDNLIPRRISTGTYYCYICGERCGERDREIHALEHRSIIRSLTILKKHRQCKKGRNYLRKIFAAYRLIRYNNIDWKRVEFLTKIPTVYLRRYVGEAFKYSCLRSDRCWAKPILEEK